MADARASTPKRLGLALSGGGFRASFFHIGVLARLADLDLLRRLHVISTVSGGSILGALYYLELRRLLGEATGPVPQQRYVDLVRSMAVAFEQAVQKNLRARTVSNVVKNLFTLRADYSRSDRLAELYWELFYRPALGGAPDRSAEAMSRLGLAPDGGEAAPVLVVNAASLNTGHRFEFTTRAFGEIVAPSRAPVDKNLLLEPSAYDQPQAAKYRDLPLSVAVAASSAVPGVFPPLALTDLYEGVTPELVDGGVYENQGLEGLLTDERACTHLIVSDASGQLEDLPRPDPMALSVIMRSPPILMDRVREECYEGLNLRQGRTVQQHIYIHLKHALPREVRACRGRDDQGSRTDLADLGQRAGLAVDVEVQRALALVRTDLDAFSEVEAESLMAFGYLLAERLVPAGFLDPASAAPPPRSSWHFLRVEPYLRDPSIDARYLRQLTAARVRVGKPLLVNRWLRWTAGLGLLAGLALILSAVVSAWRAGDAARIIDAVARTTLAVLAIVGVAYLLAVMPGKSPRVQRLRRLPLRAMATALWATLFCAASNVYLLTLNRLFLFHGRVARLAGARSRAHVRSPVLDHRRPVPQEGSDPR